MQEKISQEKRRATAKPPAARTGRIIGRDTAAGKGPNSTTSISAIGCNKGLAIVLYGIQDSFGLPSGDHKQRIQQMMKEILIRKALSPAPPRRLTLRWRNFRPAPSRLSTMSTV